MLIIFFLGMFLDPTGIIFIIAPIGFPLIKSLGFDSIWFGVLLVIGLQMGYLTPPFGFNLFYLKATAPPGVTMSDIYRSIWPFVGILILGLALIMIFPEIALWLPNILIEVK
jgi:TRAP-type mannitol/chloroaromatic compound transport system permease large subunit